MWEVLVLVPISNKKVFLGGCCEKRCVGRVECYVGRGCINCWFCCSVGGNFGMMLGMF